MNKLGLLFVFLCFTFSGFSQEENQTIKGKVLNDANDLPIENVHIVNMNQVVGSISKEDGAFSIPARVNDTLYFSYLGW